MLCLTASRLYALMGQLDEAVEWIRRALAQPLSENERIAPLLELGIIFRRSGRNEEAKKVLEEALHFMLRRARQNPRLYHELGLVERSLGCPSDAKPHFEKALHIVNSDPLLRSDRDYIRTLHLEIAEVCYDLGDYRTEAQIYRDILAIFPQADPSYSTFRLLLARSEIIAVQDSHRLNFLKCKGWT